MTVKGGTVSTNETVKLDSAIDREAYEYLCDHHPEFVDGLEEMIKHGWTADAIYRHAIKRLGGHRSDIVKRLENAARYLGAGK
jgi:hypothetical protein